MKIKKRYRILEVRGTIIRNHPFELLIGQGQDKSDENRSRLVINQAICLQFGIPYTLGLTGRHLVVTLESREIPKRDGDSSDGGINWDHFDTEQDLLFKDLYLKERINRSFTTLPDEHSTVEQKRVLKLRSHVGGGSVRTPRCPRYNLRMLLDESEYCEVKNLPLNTVFRISLKLESEQPEG